MRVVRGGVGQRGSWFPLLGMGAREEEDDRVVFLLFVRRVRPQRWRRQRQRGPPPSRQCCLLRRSRRRGLLMQLVSRGPPIISPIIPPTKIPPITAPSNDGSWTESCSGGGTTSAIAFQDSRSANGTRSATAFCALKHPQPRPHLASASWHHHQETAASSPATSYICLAFSLETSFCRCGK